MFLTTITEPGDCGSWVVDFDGKVLYGYITAGDPGTSIGYIIPAYQAFSDIEKQTGATVTFPSPEIRSDVTGRNRSRETGLIGNLAFNILSNNYTGIIQKCASRISKKIQVLFLTPKIVSLRP